MVKLVYWNPWHGCTKISPGCTNCYVYRMDKRFGRNPMICKSTGELDMPIWKNRKGEYKIPSGSKIMMCFTSDFLLDDADKYRSIAWDCIRERSDCTFMFITKRIDRFKDCIPSYWDEIKDRIDVCSTCENQSMADYRIPILLNSDIVHRSLCVEPMLEEIDIGKYLATGKIHHVTIGGESGSGARVCDIRWVLKLVDSCKENNVHYWFKQTGARFRDISGTINNIARCNQYKEAHRYGLYTLPLDDLVGGDMV